MKSDRSGLLSVSKEGSNGLAHVGAKFLPGVGLREDRLGEALGDESAVPVRGYPRRGYETASIIQSRR